MISFFVSVLIVLLIIFLFEYPGNAFLFTSKFDKNGKTREDKIFELREKIVASKEVMHIRTTVVREVPYLYKRVEPFTTDYTATVTWEKGLQILKRDGTGKITHLEGMPERFLRELQNRLSGNTEQS